MIKHYTLLLFLLSLLTSQVYGQGANSYSFAESAGTYSIITGTASTATGDDGIQDALPIGFTFNFGGNSYTTFGVTTNGFLKLGTAIVTGVPSYSNAFATTTNAPMIAGFWDDNGMANAQGGSIQYLTQGSPGTQTLTVQWTNCAFATSGVGANIDFQIVLHESSDIIDIVYDSISATATGITASIGLVSGTGNFLSVTPGSPSTYSTVTANDAVSASSTAILTTGTTYTFTPPAGCTGTPALGQTTATVSAACVGAPFTLGVTGIPVESGYSYEFQSSPAGQNTFTSLGTPQTANTYAIASQTAPTDYRVIVTCTNSSLSTTATMVSVTQNLYYNCYCTPASGCTNEGIENVAFSTLNNTSAFCVNANGYTDYGNLGSLATVTQGQQISMSVAAHINSSPRTVGVWIDYNHNGAFDATEFTSLGIKSGTFPSGGMSDTFTANVNIPAGALTGITRMRVRSANQSGITAASACVASGVFGEFEDYLITINGGTACAAMPVGGDASASVSSLSCSSVFYLSATGYTSGVTGLNFQWQESNDNVLFTNLGSSTTDYEPDTITSISQTKYFRLQVTCTNGSLISYSDTDTVLFAPISTFPWIYDVETQNTTTNSSITNDCWSSIPTATTSAYRWDVDASGSTPSSTTGPNSAYSGVKYFYTEASNGVAGDSAKLMFPAIDVTSLTAPQLSFYYHMFGATMGNLYVQINNAGTWVALDSLIGQQQTAMGDPWLKRTVNLTGYTGTINLRFLSIRSTNFYGDMSIDDISIMQTPLCPAPQSPTSSNITTTGADLAWTETGSATLWEIEYGVGTAYALGTGSRIVVNSNPYTITVPSSGAGTQYSYFVRSICGPGDSSIWSGRSAGFTTLPTCLTPTTLGATNITGNSADLSWTEPGSATAWEVEYATGNTFTIGNGNRSYTTTNPHAIASLNSGSQYSFFVRSVCGPNDTSAWSGRYTFNTTLANDLPVDAISINLNAGCTNATYSNLGGTFATGEPSISCRGTSITVGAPVWFKFVAPAGGFVRVSTDATGTMDTKLGLFTTSNPGDPTDLASFSIIGCDDDNGVTVGTASIVYAGGLTPGDTYYVAVDHYNGTSTGSFCVSVDSVVASMISPSGSCLATTNTTALREDYLGWATMVDAQGRLIANARRTAAGLGSNVPAYTPSLTVNTGAIRQNSGTDYYLDRNFAITYSGTAPSTYDLRLFFLNTELAALNAANPTSLSDLTVTHVSGSCAANYVANVANTALLQTGNGSTSDASWIDVNTPGFSNFYISGIVPLRIQLGDITAANIGKANRVDWNTMAESRTDKFELQRSANGKDFTTIMTKDAEGEASRYTYVDEQALQGINYYRLKMIEASGKMQYSKTVSATVSGKDFSVSAYPNPVSDNLTVMVSGVQGSNATIQITDVTGKILRTMQMTGVQETINMNNLADGIYLIKYSDTNRTQTIRINKQ